MNVGDIIHTIATILILPLQIVLVPIDMIFAQIPGIGVIPSAIRSILTFIDSIPETIVYLLGINPILWNCIFIAFTLYITASPTIQIIKKVWAWVRP